MAVSKKIKILPIEESEGLEHQNGVGGLTERERALCTRQWNRKARIKMYGDSKQ